MSAVGSAKHTVDMNRTYTARSYPTYHQPCMLCCDPTLSAHQTRLYLSPSLAPLSLNCTLLPQYPHWPSTHLQSPQSPSSAPPPPQTSPDPNPSRDHHPMPVPALAHAHSLHSASSVPPWSGQTDLAPLGHTHYTRRQPLLRRDKQDPDRCYNSAAPAVRRGCSARLRL
jgi:hypothetical protein